ncbi:hypothetical protein DID88_009581 [Monilinia fructigena]|uniref:ubiquitinyl hydrolase 1 n=1 Tax=Monilinia fructigena TaxID=38457 RepID=A0A395IML2_9HELO|nr:hypothetical protein DID88_009581 [Monilinia fructigena]
MSSRRRSSSRIRKMNSPARSASSTSSSSSSGSRSKSSVSPPPAKAPSPASRPPKTSVSPPPAKAPPAPLPKSSASPPPAKSLEPSPAAKTVVSAPPADSTDSSLPEKTAGSLVETPPSSVSSAPSSDISAPSKPSLSPPATLPLKRVAKRQRTKDETSEKRKKIYIKFVDPSRSRPVVKDGETTIKGGSPKRPHSDDDDEETTAKSESPKKRRITKKVADPSKEDPEKIRSESLRKRRNLAAAVREDSQRMAVAAQRGLANVTGVSCYRNSLLQGLLHLPKFFNFLVDQHPVETCVNPRKDCLACSLSLLSSRYWTVGSPKKEIITMLKGLEVQCKRLGWNPSGQGDPHDQITWMLERISQQITASSVASMQSIMQLVLSSRITCDNCHNVSVGDLQDELALSVPLKPRIRGGSLSSYLHKYLDETIEGYRCEKCKVMGDVHRVQSISHAPDVLFIQLKRFGYDGRKDKLALSY